MRTICEVNYLDGDDSFSVFYDHDEQNWIARHHVIGSDMTNTKRFDNPLDALENITKRIKELHE
jgi:aminoglycoside phosphotransferase